jgi:hypothetical protein
MCNERKERHVQDDDSAPPPGCRRIRDGNTYIEAMTIRRDDHGRFVNKRPGDPKAQLLLFGSEAA